MFRPVGQPLSVNDLFHSGLMRASYFFCDIINIFQDIIAVLKSLFFFRNITFVNYVVSELDLFLFGGGRRLPEFVQI